MKQCPRDGGDGNGTRKVPQQLFLYHAIGISDFSTDTTAPARAETAGLRCICPTLKCLPFQAIPKLLSLPVTSWPESIPLYWAVSIIQFVCQIIELSRLSNFIGRTEMAKSLDGAVIDTGGEVR